MLLFRALTLRFSYADTDRADRRVTGVAHAHFKDRTPLHDVLEHATRKEVAGVAVYAFECNGEQATELLDMARGHCPPAVKDIEHAIFVATAG